MAMFWVAPAVAGALGGLIARACQAIKSPHRESWAFIFIIEGTVTMAIGVLALILLPESQRAARFLTTEQRDFWAARLERDRGYRSEQCPRHHAKAAFLDWKTWLFGLSAFRESFPCPS